MTDATRWRFCRFDCATGLGNLDVGVSLLTAETVTSFSCFSPPEPMIMVSWRRMIFRRRSQHSSIITSEFPSEPPKKYSRRSAGITLWRLHLIAI
ncbi:hypothetical protein RJJ37_24775 [Rhizobium redzepovicii]|uniref:Uncharacterized protein n=1 Tax=Rhizobium redzepovicii TaxID=2867518 RepID=A0AAW8P750_9HYPH|nr:hypothetical protein [Rhizobium redzepovicii]MDR9762806.1 hypothetical protein [Rhizobium redzepovicii]MDR9780966.1 hypothetical protein [Rhizobium redzepovicii]